MILAWLFIPSQRTENSVEHTNKVDFVGLFLLLHGRSGYDILLPLRIKPNVCKRGKDSALPTWRGFSFRGRGGSRRMQNASPKRSVLRGGCEGIRTLDLLRDRETC